MVEIVRFLQELLLKLLTYNASNVYVSGGIIKTNEAGTININSNDDIIIKGTVGELDNNQLPKTNTITINTTSSDITMQGFQAQTMQELMVKMFHYMEKM